MINRVEIKTHAKHAIRDSRPNAILFTLAFLVISYILEYLTLRVMGYAGNMSAALEAFTRGDFDYNMVVTQRPMAPVISFALSIMSMMLSAGFTIFCLNISRMRTGSFGNLFDGFGIFFRVLWLNILMSIFTFLWTLLFIIPGIVALYRYRQALYLLLDNPDMTALECITASKNLMRGRKGELFILDLSFIGWWLLTFIPFAALWVSPYTNVTYASYYNTLIMRQKEANSGGGGYRQGDIGSDYTGSSDKNDGSGGGKPPWEF